MRTGNPDLKEIFAFVYKGREERRRRRRKMQEKEKRRLFGQKRLETGFVGAFQGDEMGREVGTKVF